MKFSRILNCSMVEIVVLKLLRTLTILGYNVISELSKCVYLTLLIGWTFNILLKLGEIYFMVENNMYIRQVDNTVCETITIWFTLFSNFICEIMCVWLWLLSLYCLYKVKENFYGWFKKVLIYDYNLNIRII